MNPPSALHSAMSRERKPFTYTPGGLDLSEIKSERMAKRLMRNAMNEGVPQVPVQQVQSPPATSNIAVPNFNCLPVQVFPTINLPANPKSLLRTRSHPNQPREPLVPKVQQSPQIPKPNRPENTASFYSPVNNNNASYQRPTSMYEYNPGPNNSNTLPKVNYGSTEPASYLPEMCFEAEYLRAPPPRNSNGFNTPITQPVFKLDTTVENDFSASVNVNLKEQSIVEDTIKTTDTPFSSDFAPSSYSFGLKKPINDNDSVNVTNIPVNLNNKTSTFNLDVEKESNYENSVKATDTSISSENTASFNFGLKGSSNFNEFLRNTDKPKDYGDEALSFNATMKEQSHIENSLITAEKLEKAEDTTSTFSFDLNKPSNIQDGEKNKDISLNPKNETLPENSKFDLDFSIEPITVPSISPSFETRLIEEDTRSENEQREVKVVKKQVKKESKSNVQNGDSNDDSEAQLTVKLPTKKSAAKTETKVEVVKKQLPDGSIEEVKTTITKTTVDGKTTIATKTETTIIPKEEEEEEEYEEEEEEEEEQEERNGGALVQEVTENGNDEVTEEVTIKKSPVVSGEKSKIVTEEERSETTITKKVAVVQKQEPEEEEVEEEEEFEEEVQQEETKTAVKPKDEPKVVEEKEEVEVEEDEVVEEEVVEKVVEEKEEEEVESEEIVAQPEKKEQPEKSVVVEKEEEEEEDEEYEEAEEKIEEKVEKPVETKPKDEEPENTEEEYESEKEEVAQPVSKPANEEPEQKEPEKEETIVEEKKVPQEEKPESQPAPKVEPTVPLREPSIPLEKVEDVEIKPIGSASETITKSHTQNTEIITSNERPLGPISTQTEYNRIENIVTVNRTTKTLDNTYEQLTQQGIPTVKTYFAPGRERISTSPQPSKPYQPVYPPIVNQPQERRHSLLLERLSMERQIPSSDLYQNNYQYNNQTYEQQRQWSQEPQAEVLTVSNVKPSTITNSQWYQQNQIKKDNVLYNNVAPVSPAPPSQPWNQSYLSPQPPLPPQTPIPPQAQPQPQYQPTYSDNITQDKNTTSTYQQNNYQTYTPQPTTWGSNNYNNTETQLTSTYNTQQNLYSTRNQTTTESYQKSTQQYSSSYVPPPWEQDSSYVADTSNSTTNQNYYQPPPQTSTYTPGPKQGWTPTPPKSKFSKPPPTAYIPPAPNQSFVKPVNVAEPPRVPGKKTYYSEYERRYITVPESNYIPAESKFQPQPDPSPQYYYDNNEPVESSEPQWRKELREFTEKTSQTTEQTSVKPPWEEDSKYAKPPLSSTYTPTPTWSQTLRPNSYRERSFESEYVGSQEFKTNTLGRGRPLSTFTKSNVDTIPERVRGVSVDRYNPNSYQPPVVAEHPPVQTHTLNVVPPAKSYHNPNVPAYHAQSRASAEPREQPIYPQSRQYAEAHASPLQSRSFKYLQWITGTED